MPSGFFQRNEFGTMQVDNTNPSLAYKQYGFFSVSGTNGYALEVPNSEFPCVAFSCPNPVRVSSTLWQGSTRIFNFIAAVTLGPVNVQAFVFDRPVDSGLPYGMKLWDDAGRMTFDATGKYGRVAHVFPGHGSFNGTAGRVYALCILTSTRRDQLTRVNATTVRVDSYRTGGYVNGTQVVLQEILVSTITYPDSTASAYNRVTGQNPSGLVMDVTGY